MIFSGSSVLAMVVGYWWIAPSIDTSGNKRKGKKREMWFQTDNKED
jgi:hypothetical protein